MHQNPMVPPQREALSTEIPCPTIEHLAGREKVIVHQSRWYHLERRPFPLRSHDQRTGVSLVERRFEWTRADDTTLREGLAH